MTGDDRSDLTARLERVAAIEAEIDPDRRRRGRLLADTITMVIMIPLTIALDLHVTEPLVMFALLAGALGLNRVIPMLTERRLRRERDDLLSAGGPTPIEGPTAAPAGSRSIPHSRSEG